MTTATARARKTPTRRPVSVIPQTVGLGELRRILYANGVQIAQWGIESVDRLHTEISKGESKIFVTSKGISRTFTSALVDVVYGDKVLRMSHADTTPALSVKVPKGDKPILVAKRALKNCGFGKYTNFFLREKHPVRVVTNSKLFPGLRVSCVQYVYEAEIVQDQFQHLGHDIGPNRYIWIRK